MHASRERNAANQSRSKMTPTSTVFSAAAGADGWTGDESWQSFVLDGLTTQEVGAKPWPYFLCCAAVWQV